RGVVQADVGQRQLKLCRDLVLQPVGPANQSIVDASQQLDRFNKLRFVVELFSSKQTILDFIRSRLRCRLKRHKESKQIWKHWIPLLRKNHLDRGVSFLDPMVLRCEVGILKCQNTSNGNA